MFLSSCFLLARDDFNTVCRIADVCVFVAIPLPLLPLQSGSLVLRDCDVSSSSGAGLGVEGGDLQLLRCKVHDCQTHGVAVFGDLTGKEGV